MAEEQAEQRTWHRGAITGWLTRAEYVRALALHERTGERVIIDHSGPEAAKDEDVKLSVREKIQFASEPPSSEDFGKSREDWKASKDAAMQRYQADREAEREAGC